MIVEIQFGEGGEDSKIFVVELAEAYIKYAELNRLKSEILHESEGHVILKIKGASALKYFEKESGKHCVQRIPPTETRGRRHTSIVGVAVLPIYRDERVLLKENELEIKTQRGHGAGGQHQNKTDSAVRARHLETGLQVFINGRDQAQNKREAISILTAKVNNLYRQQQREKYDSNRKNQLGSGGRSNKIRTYNFIDSRAVDHRSGIKTSKLKEIMKGYFNLLGE